MKESVLRLETLTGILSGHRVFIQTHNFPDPDAIATAFGLQYLLNLNGIDADCCYYGKIDKINTKLMISELGIDIRHANEFEHNESDYVITVDGQKNNSNFTDMVGTEIACIDHHPWTTDYSYEFVDHRLFGSCATIIADYFDDNDIEIPCNVATALLYAIKMDTANFTRGVTEDDIKAFALLNSKSDQHLMTRLNSNELELEDLRAYGAAIQNIVVYDKMGFVHIPFDCPDGLIAMVSGFILSLDSVDIAVVYAERSGGFKLSVRSEVQDLNAGVFVKNALIGIGDGGGHPTMAGGIVFPERRSILGDKPDEPIRDRFLRVYHEMMKDL